MMSVVRIYICMYTDNGAPKRGTHKTQVHPSTKTRQGAQLFLLKKKKKTRRRAVNAIKVALFRTKIVPVPHQ